MKMRLVLAACIVAALIERVPAPFVVGSTVGIPLWSIGTGTTTLAVGTLIPTAGVAGIAGIAALGVAAALWKGKSRGYNSYYDYYGYDSYAEPAYHQPTYHQPAYHDHHNTVYQPHHEVHQPHYEHHQPHHQLAQPTHHQLHHKALFKSHHKVHDKKPHHEVHHQPHHEVHHGSHHEPHHEAHHQPHHDHHGSGSTYASVPHHRRKRSADDNNNNNIYNSIFQQIAEVDTKGCALRMVCELYRKENQQMSEVEAAIKQLIGSSPKPMPSTEAQTPRGLYMSAAVFGLYKHDCAKLYRTCPLSSKEASQHLNNLVLY